MLKKCTDVIQSVVAVVSVFVTDVADSLFMRSVGSDLLHFGDCGYCSGSCCIHIFLVALQENSNLVRETEFALGCMYFRMKPVNHFVQESEEATLCRRREEEMDFELGQSIEKLILRKQAQEMKIQLKTDLYNWITTHSFVYLDVILEHLPQEKSLQKRARIYWEVRCVE